MEFTECQTDLKQAREQLKTAESNLFATREKLNKTRREKEWLLRKAGDGQNVADARLKALAKQEVELSASLDQVRKSLRESVQSEFEQSEAFHTFADPRKYLEKLSDDTPILMFPLRIQTRFKCVDASGVREGCPLAYELRLMSVTATNEILNEGRSLVVVALVNTDVHIRIFDVSGGKVVDKGENDLVAGEALTFLKHRLSPFPDEYSLSQQDKQEIIGTATSVAGHTHQLWVRVYPDDISIDTFEELTGGEILLSENELRNAQAYWIALWKSGGIESDDRAAWRSLVASHGSGRARWIEQNYHPANEPDKPDREGDGLDLILVIPTQVPLTDTERAATIAYWDTAWRSVDDNTAQTAAWDRLVEDLGDPGRAEEILRDYRPVNFADTPKTDVTRDNVVVRVSFLEWRSEDTVITKQQSWAMAPKVNILPERLVLLAFDSEDDEDPLEAIGARIPASLSTGPDPSKEEGEELNPENGDLAVGDDMKWMVDFDEAVAKGMGFKVDLNHVQARQGFWRLLVLGVRLSATKEDGKDAVESLFLHHHAGRKGFSLLPQGVPTNNTEKQGSSYSWREDPDESYNLYFTEKTPDDPRNWTDKRDGRWLAECLGIDPLKIAAAAHYSRTDQCEAKAMNIALWPATLGYFMETLMAPVFSEEVIARTRSFFTRYVSGRGMIPAIRVGKQPYGILPATPFSRMKWMRPRAFTSHVSSRELTFLRLLYDILQTIDGDWSSLLSQLSHVGNSNGDAHQILLDVVGQHPASAEFHDRNVQSFAQLLNSLNIQGLREMMEENAFVEAIVQSGMDLLSRFGYETDDIEEGAPDILHKFFFLRSDLLKGPLIDDVPLSEKDGIRAYTDDGRNYIQWLIDALSESHDALRAQSGFIDNERPTALLYLMLHHALDLGIVDTCMRLYQSAGIWNQDQVAAARAEPEFIHIQNQKQDPGSRWQHLYATEPRITNLPDMLVGDYIPTIVDQRSEASLFREQKDALERLKDVPTARLERVFVEHLDSCTYRLDAWKLSLVNYQLEKMRGLNDDTGDTPNQGIYLGAYGWLEDVAPENKQLTEAELTEELVDLFADPEHPLMVDDTNGGYIHAPSLNHAVTAAVLRNGFLANATSDNPNSLAVNLSSERVRLALSIIEGMRGGQSLSALLGYQLERGLHDRHDVEVDEFILDLRKAFPLTANRLSSTATEEGELDSIEQVEAKNVVDALALIEHIRESGDERYPFGRNDLPHAGDNETIVKAINEEVDRILNINDAVADLALAESVHQVVQGNYDRAAATLDTYSKGHFPPTPDVIKTPRSGVTLTHRVAIHLDNSAPSNDPLNRTPRARAEPAVNKWLASVLPALSDIAIATEYFDYSTDEFTYETITLAELGLSHIDLVYMVDMESEQAMTALDDVLTFHIVDTFEPRPNAEIRIHYMQAVDEGQYSLFELAPLVNSLRALILRSRPLSLGDIKMPGEASRSDEVDVGLDPSRISSPNETLGNLLGGLNAFSESVPTSIEEEDISSVVDSIDVWIDTLAEINRDIGYFGLPQQGVGFLYAWKRQRFEMLTAKINDLLSTLSNKLERFNTLMEEYDELQEDTGAEEKIRLLQKAERLISTAITTSFMDDLDGYRAHLLGPKREALEQVMRDLQAVYDKNTLHELYAGIEATETAVATVELTGIDIDEDRHQLVVFANQLRTGADNLHADLGRRHALVAELLVRHQGATTAQNKVTLLLEAAEHLFGSAFKLVPDFGISGTTADEWANAFGNSSNLLDYQTVTLDNDFPVDTWLHGVARVREKMYHVENTVLMTDALLDQDFSLTALQFPYHSEDYWLALDYPSKTLDGDDFVVNEDKLLYTAQYAVDEFLNNDRQCGLLVDEWTEVIPTENETTGLTFHYDQPNSEPPQTLLLATPADFTGAWQWADLVDTLHDTLDLAKKRAIEPVHIDTVVGYSHFLPAVISAFTVYPITAGMNVALNNRFFDIGADNDE